MYNCVRKRGFTVQRSGTDWLNGAYVRTCRAVGAGPAGAAAAGPKFGQKKWRPAYGAKRMTQNT